MLKVVLPHAFVLSTIHVLVDARPVRFVVGPKAIVDVAINMGEGSFSMSAVFSPFAIVFSAIRPDLSSAAVPKAALPLPGVNCTSLEGVGGPFLSGLVGIIEPLCYRLLGFLLSEVLARSELLGLKHRDKSSSRVPAPPSLNFDDVLNVSLEIFVVVLDALLR